jgi:uncharacterized membrane protein
MLVFSPGVFNTLKFVHILAAMIWIGTSIYLQFTATRLVRSSEPEPLATFARETEYTGTHLILPSTIVLMLAGVALVAYSPAYNFTDTWIVLAFVGYAATFVTGAFVIGPASGRIGALLDAEGPGSPAARALIKRIFAVSRVDLVVLLLVVADMVFKPSL